MELLGAAAPLSAGLFVALFSADGQCDLQQAAWGRQRNL
jgi:hypothetical protein